MYIENVFVKTRIAELLGISTALLATWEKRDTIPVKELLAYCEHSGVSIHWLLTGKGPRYITYPDSDGAIEIVAEPSAPYTTDHIATLQKKAQAYDTLIAALQPILADIAQISPIKNGKNPEKTQK
jgi:transcriptional regulator with XRE-family HTH domain